MNLNDLKRAVKEFITETPCPKCSRRFRLCFIYLMAFVGLRGLFLVGCGTCKFQMLLEITFECECHGAAVKMRKIGYTPTVSIDDIMDVQSALKDFRGDFSKIFQS